MINIGAGGAYFPYGGSVMLGDEVEIRMHAPKGELFSNRDFNIGVDGAEVNFGTRAVVLRTEKKPEFPGACCLAVKFIGPLRFARRN